MGTSRRVVMVIVGMVVWGASLVSLQARQSHIHAMVQNPVLVDVVRSAVQQFSQPSAAEEADYHPFAGCVSGPQSGAMGVHYVNGGLVGDGVVDEQHPEALVYEPKSDHLELVAVEFIVLASQWDAAHTDNLPPTLRGQVFQFNSARTAIACRRSTSSMCGWGGTTRAARMPTGIRTCRAASTRRSRLPLPH